MKILHITPSTNGYEEAILISNAIDKTNNLILIEKDGKKFMTGGFIINDTSQIRNILDEIPKKDQFDFVKSFKMDPFVKFYADKNDLEEIKK